MNPTLLTKGMNCVAVAKSLCATAPVNSDYDASTAYSDVLRDLIKFGVELSSECERLFVRIAKVKEIHFVQQETLKEECNRLALQEKETRATVSSLEVQLDRRAASRPATGRGATLGCQGC